MRLSVPLVGIFVAAGGCCCCGDFVERVKAEMAKQGVAMPEVPGVGSGGSSTGGPVVSVGGGELTGDLAGFPIYKGAELQTNASMAGVTSANFKVKGGGKPEEIAEFYGSYAKEHGWTEVAKANAGGTSTFTSSKGDKMFTASATSQGDEVWLTLAISPGM